MNYIKEQNINLEEVINFAVLAIILTTGVFAYFLLEGNNIAQILIITILAISYVLWGLLHHWITGNIHRKIVIEYILIGVIAVMMLLIILGI